jgi:hypothetical protein
LLEENSRAVPKKIELSQNKSNEIKGLLQSIVGSDQLERNIGLMKSVTNELAHLTEKQLFNLIQSYCKNHQPGNGFLQKQEELVQSANHQRFLKKPRQNLAPFVDIKVNVYERSDIRKVEVSESQSLSSRVRPESQRKDASLFQLSVKKIPNINAKNMTKSAMAPSQPVSQLSDNLVTKAAKSSFNEFASNLYSQSGN